MNSISVRKASNSDCKEVYIWRNDLTTRLMSHNTKVIKWEDHIIWFKNSFNSRTKILLICEDSIKKRIAFVHCDLNNKKGVISINLSPEERGKGYSKTCLKKAIEYIKINYNQLNFLIAEIKEINHPSKKLFINLRFNLYDLKNGIGFYKKDL